jgi:hypothetical protein
LIIILLRPSTARLSDSSLLRYDNLYTAVLLPSLRIVRAVGLSAGAIGLLAPSPRGEKHLHRCFSDIAVHSDKTKQEKTFHAGYRRKAVASSQRRRCQSRLEEAAEKAILKSNYGVQGLKPKTF